MEAPPRKKIALIYDSELWIGGVETHLASLVKLCDPDRFHFTVISPIATNFQTKIELLGARALSIPRYKPLDPGITRQMNYIFRQEGIDLVHAHSPTAAIPARLAARTAGIPAMITVHIPSIKYYGELRTLRARSGRALYIAVDRWLNHRMTSRLVYVSHQVHTLYTSKNWSPAGRSIVIPNGIDLDPFRLDRDHENKRAALGIAPDVPVITFVGRLSVEKGLDNLLVAARILQDRFPSPFHIWIIGAGPFERQYQRMIRNLGLSAQVSLLGQHARVADYLLSSNIFVLPSHLEAMSIALLEAMAAGLPSVVTNVGDSALMVESGYQGLVTKSESAQALAEALYQLLIDPAMRKRMGENARRKAQAFSDWRMAEQIQLLYQQVLETQA
jgi:glycosyltransferase involved in cell wall biosynthesis